MQIGLLYELPERALTTDKIKLRKILMIDLKIFVYYYVDQYFAEILIVYIFLILMFILIVL